MMAHIAMLEAEVTRYQGHLVRKHKASSGQMDLLSRVTAQRALFFIDYKMKVLPAENKEAQTKIFGKKGKSLFGMVAMFQLPDGYDGEVPDGIDIEGDYAIAYFRVCADDADQDFVHSIQVFEQCCKYFKKQYPWVTEAMLYSDGAGNFRSLSFEFLMAERIADVGIKVVSHLLPEAGDGKDRVDRDFAGVNRLFWAWLSRPGASMQNAEEMYKALEYGKKVGDGVVNCAVAIAHPPTKTSVDAAAFTALVGKARDNMYYTEFEYDTLENGKIVLTGCRFYAYYKMGTGVYLNANQLKSLWPDKVQMEEATILCGDGVSAINANKRPKMERNGPNKKAEKEKKAEARRGRDMEIEAKAAAANAALRARQTSKHCATCDRSFLGRGLKPHALVCKSLCKQTKATKEARANTSNKFDVLTGCAVAACADDGFPVPQCDGYEFPEEFPPLKLPKAWQQLVDLMATDEYVTSCSAVPSPGWATKEQCRRPTITFGPEVKTLLRWCFDAKPRMNNYEIHKRLKEKFKLGPRVLRITQIAGWVSGELARRKKAAAKAAEDAAHLIQQACNTAELNGDEPEVSDAEIDAVFGLHSAALQKDYVKENLPAWKEAWRKARSAEWQQGAKQADNCDQMACADKYCRAVQKERNKQEKAAQKKKAAPKKQKKKKIPEVATEVSAEPVPKKQRKILEAATKVSAEPTLEQQKPLTSYCWICRRDVLESDWNKTIGRCSDEDGCEQYKAEHSQEKRQRKSSRRASANTGRG